MGVFQLLTLLLAAYGIYRIFRFSNLPPVKWFRSFYLGLWGSKAEELIKCPLCLGTHIGVIMIPLSFLPLWVLFPPLFAAGIFLIHQLSTLVDEINFFLDPTDLPTDSN